MSRRHSIDVNAIKLQSKALAEAADAALTDESWMSEWHDINTGETFAEFPETPTTSKERQAGYDISAFGPKIKKKEQLDKAEEIKSIMLARETDYMDAILMVDRDDFLADPHDAATRDIAVLKSLLSDEYMKIRALFLSFEIEFAMNNMRHYKEHVRFIRSLVYMSGIVNEQVERMNDKILHLEGLKEKYEATIFTLRRQLEDYHKEFNAVGRGIDGTVKVHDKIGGVAATPMISQMDGFSSEASANKYIVTVQIEDLGMLGKRHHQLMEKAKGVVKSTILALAPAYNATRTNYIEDPVKDGETVGQVATTYLFLFDEGFNSFTFALECHLQLNNSELWPQALTAMDRFGNQLWKGLRTRIGIHCGVPNDMDLPEATTIRHVEGVAVEKSMRVAALGGAGDTIASTIAWEGYHQEFREARVPPSKRYQTLREVVTESISCAKKRGFKKGECATKIWGKALEERKAKPMDTEFGPISFFRLEAGNATVADDEPTTDDLLQAKDTEMLLMQQELDQLRMDVMKRDSDMEELKEKMLFTVAQLSEKSKVRDFWHMATIESLENQLMAASDADMGAVPEVATDVPSTTSSAAARKISSVFMEEMSTSSDPFGWIKFVDEKRLQKFSQFNETLKKKEEVADSKAENKRRLSRENSQEVFTIPKHSNQKMWRDLKKMVHGAGQKVLGQRKPIAKLPSFQKEKERENISLMLRLHGILRVFSVLMKRFTAVGEETDQDNQSITEEQFIALYMKAIQPDGFAGSAREALHLLAQSAIENEETERANGKDDSRLVRSSGGHLAKVFQAVKLFKTRMVVDARQAAAMQNNADSPLTSNLQVQIPAAATTAATAGGGGGGQQLTDGTRKKVGGSSAKGKGTAAGGGGRTPVASSLQPPSRTSGSKSVVAAAAIAEAAASKEFEKELMSENKSLKAEVDKLKAQLRSAGGTSGGTLHTPTNVSGPSVGTPAAAGAGGKRKSITQTSIPGKSPAVSPRATQSPLYQAVKPGGPGGRRKSLGQQQQQQQLPGSVGSGGGPKPQQNQQEGENSPQKPASAADGNEKQLQFVSSQSWLEDTDRPPMELKGTISMLTGREESGYGDDAPPQGMQGDGMKELSPEDLEQQRTLSATALQSATTRADDESPQQSGVGVLHGQHGKGGECDAGSSLGGRQQGPIVTSTTRFRLHQELASASAGDDDRRGSDGTERSAQQNGGKEVYDGADHQQQQRRGTPPPSNQQQHQQQQQHRGISPSSRAAGVGDPDVELTPGGAYPFSTNRGQMVDVTSPGWDLDGPRPQEKQAQTEVEAFQIDDRIHGLREKWATEKELRHQQQLELQQREGSPLTLRRLTPQSGATRKQQQSTLSSSNQNGYSDPPRTLAPLQVDITKDGGIQIIGYGPMYRHPQQQQLQQQGGQNISPPPPNRNSSPVRQQQQQQQQQQQSFHPFAKLPSCEQQTGLQSLMVQSSTLPLVREEAARQMQRQEKERQEFEAQQLLLQQRLVELRQLQAMSRGLMEGSASRPSSRQAVGFDVMAIRPTMSRGSSRGSLKQPSTTSMAANTATNISGGIVGVGATTATPSGTPFVTTRLEIPRSRGQNKDIASIVAQYKR